MGICKEGESAMTEAVCSTCKLFDCSRPACMQQDDEDQEEKEDARLAGLIEVPHSWTEPIKINSLGKHQEYITRVMYS